MAFILSSVASARAMRKEDVMVVRLWSKCSFRPPYQRYESRNERRAIGSGSEPFGNWLLFRCGVVAAEPDDETRPGGQGSVKVGTVKAR